MTPVGSPIGHGGPDQTDRETGRRPAQWSGHGPVRDQGGALFGLSPPS